jgi:hypothetical protein
VSGKFCAELMKPAAGESLPAGARAAMRKSKKRKASALIIDDLDNLQIR